MQRQTQVKQIFREQEVQREFTEGQREIFTQFKTDSCRQTMEHQQDERNNQKDQTNELNSSTKSRLINKVANLPSDSQIKMIKFEAKDLQPFFQAQILSDRMKLIRKNFIQPIRQSYNEVMFYENTKILKQIFPKIQNHIEMIKYSYWTDDPTTKVFNLIKAYTNQSFCKNMIALVNSVLRNQKLSDQKLMKLTVFMIEAINIQLFLLTMQRPHLRNFEGKVYRGLTCSVDDYHKFTQINLNKKPQDRVISVPLSLWGSSKDIKISQKFLKMRRRQGFVAIILAINVINLENEDLKFYKDIFPDSIVSTICAVDISDPSLSYHPQQNQVLLRGAFCMILQISQIQKMIKDEQMTYIKIECVMANANRDHISTNHLGDKKDMARDLFASINRKARLKYACKYYKNIAQFAQKQQYFYKQLELEGQKLQKIKQYIEKNANY